MAPLRNLVNFKLCFFFYGSGGISTLSSSSLVDLRSRSLQLDNEVYIPSNLISNSSSGNPGMSNHVVEACMDTIELDIILIAHVEKKEGLIASH
jgi:hypothetical protein